MVISLLDRLGVPATETSGRLQGGVASNADVIELPVQDLQHTLRFITPENGLGQITIQIIDERTGRVVRQIPWDSSSSKGSGSLFNYKV